MPLLTAAPLPLLYGCVTTRAPALRASSAVPSVDPSSTTMISCQDATERRPATTDAMAAASLNAGMMTETDEGSATDGFNPKQFFDHAVPADSSSRVKARLTK